MSSYFFVLYRNLGFITTPFRKAEIYSVIFFIKGNNSKNGRVRPGG
jgi:hypothetical protein